MTRNPIFCAIDTNDIHKATSLLSEIAPHIGGIKIGLEFFTSLGVKGIEEVKKSPILHVLDYASVPISNSSPNRVIFVIVSGLVGFIFSCSRAIFTNDR